MIQGGRSKQAFNTWLVGRPLAWRDGIEVVATARFIGFKPATSEELLEAVTVMDPFDVVRPLEEALDQRRRRGQHPRPPRP